MPCHSFTFPPSPRSRYLNFESVASQRKRIKFCPRPLFRELITDDEEDLRAEITAIKKQDGLDEFLKIDDRLCVIKLFAPYCKACKAFGAKFRKLATDKGDRFNAAREAVCTGDARFGEIDYASNVKLCRSLGVKTFPSVLIFRGGEKGTKLSEIVCNQKKKSIDQIVSQMDQLMTAKDDDFSSE